MHPSGGLTYNFESNSIYKLEPHILVYVHLTHSLICFIRLQASV